MSKNFTTCDVQLFPRPIEKGLELPNRPVDYVPPKTQEIQKPVVKK